MMPDIFLKVFCSFADGYDKGVKILRTQHEEDCSKVAVDIFAHYYILGRNTLAVKLIVRDTGKTKVVGATVSGCGIRANEGNRLIALGNGRG